MEHHANFDTELSLRAILVCLLACMFMKGVKGRQIDGYNMTWNCIAFPESNWLP